MVMIRVLRKLFSWAAGSFALSLAAFANAEPAPASDPAPSEAAVAAPEASAGSHRDPSSRAWLTPQFAVMGRAYVQYQLGNPQNAERRDAGEPRELVWDSLRVGADARQGIWRAELELELLERSLTLVDGRIEERTHPAYRDAWIQLEPWRALRLRVGNMKKPVSRLRLESRAQLPGISRGIVVGELVDDLGYGGRDLGVTVGGRVGHRLRLKYAAGVFEGTSRRRVGEDFAGDFAGRLEVDWRKLASVGLDLSHRNRDAAAGVRQSGTLLGADLELRLWHFHAVVEGHMGQDPSLASGPTTGGLIGQVSRKFDLSRCLELEPVLGSEVYYVPNDRLDLRILRQYGGVNLHFGKHARLMLQGEQTARPNLSEPDRALVFQVAIEE
jgi:hypothetical protein